jgi:hypothetical protein
MRILVALSAAALACAQGTTPKPSAAEYPVHGEARGIAIGAEYMVHSFGGGEQMYVVENYLVVEVALYPPKEAKIAPDPGQFALRINGKKTALMPQPPAMVAASLSHPEWQQPPRATADAGAGPVNVGLGYPPNRQPFPGAPMPPRLPNPPRAPDSGPPGGIDRAPAAKPEEVLVQTALPADVRPGPVSGFLYFPFTGKTGSIKSLELSWEGCILKLR